MSRKPSCEFRCRIAGLLLTFIVGILAVDALAAEGSGAISNTEEVSASNETDPVSGSDSVAATVDLAVSITESVDPVAPGFDLTYTVTVTNNGPLDATDVVLREELTLPAGVSIDSIEPSNSTAYTPPHAPNGDWIVGDLDAGVSEILTVVLTVDALAATGTNIISNKATVDTVNETDTESGNDSATENTSITGLIGQAKKLTAADAASGDQLGYGVSISGDTIVVGTEQEGAYVFERIFGDAGNWGETKRLTGDDPTGRDRFGVSTAISGDTIVVGADLDDTGSAYVFERNHGGEGNWGLAKKLTANDANGGDQFGFSVSISGDTVVVGSIHGNSAYIFERNHGGSDNWGLTKKLTANDAAASVLFGHSVSISDSTVVVGARLVDFGVAGTGSAYVFERNHGGEGNWGQAQKLNAEDVEPNDLFGYSVSIDGDTVAVSAPFDDNTIGDTGSAYVFERDLGGVGNWGQAQKLIAADAEADDQLGFSVSISGNVVLIGSWFDDDKGINSGSAYVFKRDFGGVGNWGQAHKIISSDLGHGDHFGRAVAINDDTAVIGATNDDDAADDAGAAYVFDFADLAVSMDGPIDPVVAGSGVGNLTFTVTLTNNGPKDASGVVVDEDLTLPTGVEIFSVNPRDSTTFDYTDFPDGLWTVGSLAAGESATLEVVLTASASALTSAISNKATLIAMNEWDTSSINNSANASTSIAQEADLRVTNDASDTSAIPGKPLTYTIIASNAGPSDNGAARLIDIFPPDLDCTYTSVADGGAAGNTSTDETGAVHLNETLSLPSGSEVTYTVDCEIDSAATVTLLNTATISSLASVTDPTPDNDSATEETTLKPQADLSVIVTDGVTSAILGGSLTYTIDVSNLGPSDDPEATLTDDFPTELTWCSYTSQSAGGLTGNTEGLGNLDDELSMPADSSVRYIVDCAIKIDASGTLSNTATIRASVIDPNSGSDNSNNSSTDDDTRLVEGTPLTVVTPNGGELWIQSLADEPANVEPVSWTMPESVCQVEVDLLLSNDGGMSYVPLPADPPSSDWPRVFGPGGDCQSPGVETTSFTYNMPEAPPSGSVGSLYKLIVKVTDRAGNTRTDESDRPFYFVEPSNDSIKTLILWHSQRMTELGMDTTGLLANLTNLAAQPLVQGWVVDLNGVHRPRRSLRPLGRRARPRRESQRRALRRRRCARLSAERALAHLHRCRVLGARRRRPHHSAGAAQGPGQDPHRRGLPRPRPDAGRHYGRPRLGGQPIPLRRPLSSAQSGGAG